MYRLSLARSFPSRLMTMDRNMNRFSTVSFEGLSKEQVELQLVKIKRKMSNFYNKGHYKSALEYAIKMEDATSQLMGKQNTVYASSVNNVALMNKMLGYSEVAMDKYTEALRIYEMVSGKNNTSYAATLANLGVLYKNMAHESKGMNKLQLLERSQEALMDARQIRVELLGASHKDSLFSALHLGTTLKAAGKLSQSEDLLRESLALAKSAYGEEDTVVASILNALGTVLKATNALQEAKTCYEQALQIQCDGLGDKHPDSIITRHNLAELYIAMGDDTSAADVQEHVLELLDVDVDEVEEVPATEPTQPTVQSSASQQQSEESPFQSASSSSSSDRSATVEGVNSVIAHNAQRNGAADPSKPYNPEDDAFWGFDMEEEKVEAKAPPITFATRKNTKKNNKP